jgi:hypothetical protein
VSQTPSKLERRARALLRAYPAEYRHGRAEEMIGTLLEAAPPGRSSPTAREAWSLIAGGRHARTARNRRPGVKANVRLAVLLGISIYLSFHFGSYIARSLGFWPSNGTSWLANTTGALGLAVALAPWLGSRAATASLAIPSCALCAYGELRGSIGFFERMSVADFLIITAALVTLTGGPTRLPRSWLWLPCVFPLALVAGRLLSSGHDLGPALENSLYLGAMVPLAVLVVCWLVTDARPAFALCLSLLLGDVIDILTDFGFGDSMMMIAKPLLIQLAIVLPILLSAAWLLLRQKTTPSSRSLPGR